MKGDFTRSTFNREKHYSSVRMQQGRVQLDADWNEQMDIEAHLDQTEAKDVIGLCGAPKTGGGFQIGATTVGSDLTISPGRIYVDGILCENEQNVLFTEQPDLPGASLPTQPGIYLAYLDVWQRHLTALEDPDIREVALSGPDTATRTKTIWQVKLLQIGANDNCLSDVTIEGSTGKLRARARPEATPPNLCVVPASAGYRRLENQLYRVEIHESGSLGTATFKWSRDNGSVIFPIKEFIDNQPTNQIRVNSLGQDQVLTLRIGDWVEVLGDETELRLGEDTGAGPILGTLAQINAIDEAERVLTLSADVSARSDEGHPKVRRPAKSWSQCQPPTTTILPWRMGSRSSLRLAPIRPAITGLSQHVLPQGTSSGLRNPVNRRLDRHTASSITTAAWPFSNWTATAG
jgi:hypothetical protein